MTGGQFVRMIESYYDPYPSSTVRSAVCQYVDGVPDDEREIVLELVIRSVSSQYKATPDVAAIHRVREEHDGEVKRRTGQVWREKETGKVFCGERRIGSFSDRGFVPLIEGFDDAAWERFRRRRIESAHDYADFLREEKLLPAEEGRRRIGVEGERNP